jgi:hypothetical protein
MPFVTFRRYSNVHVGGRWLSYGLYKKQADR